MSRLPRSYFVHSRRPDGGEYRVQVLDGRAVCCCTGYTIHGHCWHERRAIYMDEQARGEETRALVPIEVMPPAAPLPTRSDLDIIAFIAKRAVAARGMLPQYIKTEDEAIAVMVAGWEFGAKPMTALRHVYVINGKTEPDAQLMLGIVKARDPSARFIFHETTVEVCDAELLRKGASVLRLRCTIDEVPKALREKPGPWGQYRRDMLRWYTVRRVCRLGAPDLINTLGGISVTEAGDYMANGEEGYQPEAVAVEAQALPAEALVNEGDEAFDEAAIEAEAAPVAETPDEAASEPAPAHPKFDNLGQLWTRATKELGFANKRACLDALGLTDDTQVADYDIAWAALVKVAAARKAETPA